MKYIQIIDGPNLNLTGTRQPQLFGEIPISDVVEELRTQLFPKVECRYFQSNIEGELINELHKVGFDDECMGVILNGGAYTHTSLALADAVAAIPVSVVEVHISNIFNRGKLRAKSYLASVCKGSITGFGLDSYRLAVQALLMEHAL